MASIQKKGDAWYCQFMHHGKRHTFTVGKVSDSEATATAAKVDYSFVSACASRGIDQRLIDGWEGHTTEEMRRR